MRGSDQAHFFQVGYNITYGGGTQLHPGIPGQRAGTYGLTVPYIKFYERLEETLGALIDMRARLVRHGHV
jgi:hypothetical protein